MSDKDLVKNYIPEDVKTIHLIAICGTGMAALAGMLKDQGFTVSGSDRKIYPPMSDFLAQKKIFVADGFSPENVSDNPDLVVIGNAVSRDNPEVMETLRRGLNFCSMPQAVNHFGVAHKKTLLIAGTHGKSTTSSILTWILYQAGQCDVKFDPSYFIGGILKNFNSNYRLGRGSYMVIEGDEYDTAFFDKGPKFLHYDPLIAVLTSVEFDHADIFRDLDHVMQTFDRFLSRLSSDSLLLVYDGDDNIARLVKGKHCDISSYGLNPDSTWHLKRFFVQPPWTTFEVYRQGRPYGHFKTRLMGRHNLMNTLAAIAAAVRLDVPRQAIATALETFEGVKRRQEVRGIKNNITIIDDFAHHPTAVKETLCALKPFCTGGRLIAVFEPRTNSSMRKVFQDVYPSVFDPADVICIRKPPLLHKIPPNERFSSEVLVADLNARGKNAIYFSDTDLIVDYLAGHARPGDHILVMSNGAFDNIHEKLLKAL